MKMIPPTPQKTVTGAEIESLCRLACSGFKVVTPTIVSGEAALVGDFELVELRPGLTLHSSHARDVYNLTTQIDMPQAMILSVILEGSVDFSVGDRAFSLGAHTNAPGTGRAEGMLLSIGRPDVFVRRSRAGVSVRKVNLTLEPEWFGVEDFSGIGGDARIARFGRAHLATMRWRPTARMLALAEQILRPPTMTPLLRTMYLECRAIDMVTEVLAAVADDSVAGRRMPAPRDCRRAQAVRDFLEANLDRSFSLGTIARELGLSVTALQRHFRAIHGTTVFDYLRDRKMERARQALEAEGATVAEAAYRAGYASAANFATAFKRRYGISPKYVRIKI